MSKLKDMIDDEWQISPDLEYFKDCSLRKITELGIDRRFQNISHLSNLILRIQINPSKKTVFVQLIDGRKALVRCHPEDEFDEEIGVALAVCRALCGSKSQFKKYLNSDAKYIHKEAKNESGR